MSDSRKPRCRSYHATVASGEAELTTTCDSRTGMDSPTSILRCARTATPALTSIVRPSLSKNRNPYPPPGVASAPGSLTSRTPSAASLAARASTSAELAAPNAIRSIRLSGACRNRITYCSGEPSAARKVSPLSLCSAVSPQTPLKKSSCFPWSGMARSI